MCRLRNERTWPWKDSNCSIGRDFSDENSLVSTEMRREKRMACNIGAKVHVGACVGVERGQGRSKEAEGTPWTLVVATRELKMWILTWTRRPASCQTQQPKEELTIHPRSIENLKREEEKKQGHRERRRGITRNSWKMSCKCSQSSLTLATSHANDPSNHQFDCRGHGGVC